MRGDPATQRWAIRPLSELRALPCAPWCRPRASHRRVQPRCDILTASFAVGLALGLRRRARPTSLASVAAAERWESESVKSQGLETPFQLRALLDGAASRALRRASAVIGRRRAVSGSLALSLSLSPASSVAITAVRKDLTKVTDPQTYSALAYTPPKAAGKLPLILVLHGAGKNELDAWNLADPQGEHGGLIPSLISSGKAPPELTDNFAVVAPYSAGKRSFYEEPRKKLLQFAEWVCSEAGRQAGCPDVDPKRIFLFGFSDGATVGVELALTRRFAGCVIAAYGITSDLPAVAAERLKNLPIWVFHSADDAIFPVSCSDKLVRGLKKVNTRDVLRYTRYDRDQEGFTGSVRGHSTGISASKLPEIYSWMLSI